MTILSESSAAFTNISSNDVLSRRDWVRGVNVEIAHLKVLRENKRKEFDRDENLFGNLIGNLTRLRNAAQHH